MAVEAFGEVAALCAHAATLFKNIYCIFSFATHAYIHINNCGVSRGFQGRVAEGLIETRLREVSSFVRYDSVHPQFVDNRTSLKSEL